MKTIKDLLKKNPDPYQALLNYHTTPLQNGYSPAELLMGRKLRAILPIISSQKLPKLPNQSVLSQTEQAIKEKQKRNFDTRHCATLLPTLRAGEEPETAFRCRSFGSRPIRSMIILCQRRWVCLLKEPKISSEVTIKHP